MEHKNTLCGPSADLFLCHITVHLVTTEPLRFVKIYSKRLIHLSGTKNHVISGKRRTSAKGIRR